MVMCPTLTSQGLVLVTAMAVSAAATILFDLLRQKYFPPTSQIHRNHQNQPLKSCLSSGSKKTEKKKKKKKVKFADCVKDRKGNGELWGEIQKQSCGNEISGSKKMPANHVALYSGILKDRVQRMEYSH